MDRWNTFHLTGVLVYNKYVGQVPFGYVHLNGWAAYNNWNIIPSQLEVQGSFKAK